MKKQFLVTLESEEDKVDGADLFVALSGNWNGVFVSVEEAAQQSVQADGAFCACVENWSLDVRGNCSNCDLPRRR